MSIRVLSPTSGSTFDLKDLIEITGSSGNGITLVKLSTPYQGTTYLLNQIPTNADGSWRISVTFNTGGDREIVAEGFNDQGSVAKETIKIKLSPGTVAPSATPSYTTLVPIRPLPPQFNQGLTSAKESTMRRLLGVPGNLTTNCSPVTNTALKRLITTENVGPFRVTGLKPAVEALKRIFSQVKADKPALYAQLGTAGMLCCRAVRGSSTKFSNHSWGTAIDIKISSQLDPVGDGTAQFGLVELAPYFNTEKFFWGAGFSSASREDSMHFEASEQLLQDWKASGQI